MPARLMVISLNPAPSDDETGQLISGQHGRLLDNMLAAIGLAPEQVFRTAWLRCTPRVAIKTTPEEQVRCAAFIRQEFAWVQPQAVLLLGNSFYDPARRWLLEQLIGHTPAFTVPHPAILLRQPELKAQAWHSLKQLKAALAKA
ncbi:uracil-DNA glycosylase family protein [Eikenella corrodens]